MTTADDLTRIAGELTAAAADVRAIEEHNARLIARIAELEAQQPPPPPPPPLPPTDGWADTFSTGWVERWNVGARNGLAKTSTVDGDKLLVNVPAGATGVFAAHASPFQPFEHAILRYTVRFLPGWRWTNSRGGGHGKMSGLAGKLVVPNSWAVGAGGKRWNGESEVYKSNLADADGWSLKVLFLKDRRVSLYIYCPSPYGVSSANSYFGATISGSNAALLGVDVDNRIEVEVKMNTPGQNDGVARLRLNGTQVAYRDTIQWRSAKRPTLAVTQALVNFQFGGPSSDAPDVPMSLVYSDFTMERAA